jgi:hypothetical protein
MPNYRAAGEPAGGLAMPESLAGVSSLVMQPMLLASWPPVLPRESGAVRDN